MEKNQITLNRIRNGLIVSCQALEDEPLHSSFIMMRMAKAAQLGEAAGIRANTPRDCKKIMRNVDLPMIAIYKKVYQGSQVFITPTMKEFKALAATGAEIIAFDATKRARPGGKELKDYIKEAKRLYQGLLMADISTYEEGIEAANLGVDLISTTLSGYTEYTINRPKPDFELLEKLCKTLGIPVIAEGNVETPSEAAECFKRGAFAVVVGGAITRPQLITQKFVNAIKSADKQCLRQVT
jgi:N-acylglucosamine-6-phosphate 2-epimerase